MYNTYSAYQPHGMGDRQLVTYNGGNMGGNNGQQEPTKICYQVDFNAVAVGKVIAMSKRRIRWRYGFPNKEALDSGKSGIDCRGEEHDVTLVWSVTSGKRLLMSNNQQIYIGSNKSKMFEYVWYDKNGTNLRIIAHSSQPMSGASGCRQYDLFIDGKSFFTLPKVYEVGLKSSSVQDGRVPGIITKADRLRLEYNSPYSTYSQTTSEQEKAELKRAIEASLQESRAHLASRGRMEDDSVAASTLTNTVDGQYVSNKMPQQEDQTLIDFLSDPAPGPTPDSQALVPVGTLQTQYQLDNPFDSTPQPVQDEFAPREPTYNDLSNQILMGYGTNMNSVETNSNPVPLASMPANPFDNTAMSGHAMAPQQQNYSSQPLNAGYQQTQQQQPGYQPNYYGNYQM